jgi:hypothetical protein
MPASHGHNQACCNIPPIVSSGYSPKGSYKEYDGLKTCTERPRLETPSISNPPS